MTLSIAGISVCFLMIIQLFLWLPLLLSSQPLPCLHVRQVIPPVSLSSLPR